jgi:hypothetical protein
MRQGAPSRRAALAAVFLLFLAAAMAAAQEGVKSPFDYNPQTVETLKGLVVSVSPGVHDPTPQLVIIQVSTAGETLPVWLGPNWFVESRGLKISALDRVEVTGSRLRLDGRPVILAAQVKKGDKILKLRNDQGQPLWGPQPPAKANQP